MERFDRIGRMLFPEERGSKAEPQVEARGGKILVRQVYCPRGHELISEDNSHFGDWPGIKVICQGREFSEEVELSPIHQDTNKKFERPFQKTEILTISCPTCGATFPDLAPHDCTPNAMYVSMFLTKTPDVHDSVNICNAWDCYASFLRLFSEVITSISEIPPPISGF